MEKYGKRSIDGAEAGLITLSHRDLFIPSLYLPNMPCPAPCTRLLEAFKQEITFSPRDNFASFAGILFIKH